MMVPKSGWADSWGDLCCGGFLPLHSTIYFGNQADTMVLGKRSDEETEYPLFHSLYSLRYHCAEQV